MKEISDINAQLQKSNNELSNKCSTIEQEREKSQIKLDKLRAQLSTLQTEKHSLIKQYKEISELHAVRTKAKNEIESDLMAKSESYKNLEDRYQKCLRDIPELKKTKENLTKSLET